MGTKDCVGCGREIPRTRRSDSKFCSPFCRAKYRKAYFASNGREWTPGAVIYAMRTGSRVYIGSSSALRTRVRAFKAGCPEPTEFVGAIPGNRQTLKRLKQQFGYARVSGSWYSAAPALLDCFQAKREVLDSFEAKKAA